MDFSTERINNVLQDAAYLTDEAEALKYVISAIPVNEKPPGGASVFEMLAIIDHAQISYYRPLIEQILVKPGSSTNVQHFEKTFDPEKYEAGNTDKLLGKMSKNRVSFITYLKKMAVSDLQKKGEVNGSTRSCAQLLEEMTQFERQQLRKIADRVLSIDKKKT